MLTYGYGHRLIIGGGKRIMTEILIAIGLGVILVWGFMLGGIFEGCNIGPEENYNEE